MTASAERRRVHGERLPSICNGSTREGSGSTSGGDFVVIGTPRINLLADGALLASGADAPVIGTVLNDIDLRRNSRDDSAYRYLAAAEQYHAGAV